MREVHVHGNRTLRDGNRPIVLSIRVSNGILFFDSTLKMYLKEHGQNQICSVSCVREKVGKCPRVWEKTVEKYNKGKLYKEANSFYFVVKRYNSNGKYFGDGDGARDFSGNGL